MRTVEQQAVVQYSQTYNKGEKGRCTDEQGEHELDLEAFVLRRDEVFGRAGVVFVGRHCGRRQQERLDCEALVDGAGAEPEL